MTVFQRRIYSTTFKYLIKNNLIPENQARFKAGDPSINQLLSIAHDISKASDKICNEGLIYKLKQNEIAGMSLNKINDFLDSRKKKVVLNGQYSSWENITAGVHQGSYLGLLFLPVYINDLTVGLSSNPKLFTVDISLYSTAHNITISTKNLNEGLKKINDCVAQ